MLADDLVTTAKMGRNTGGMAEGAQGQTDLIRYYRLREYECTDLLWASCKIGVALIATLSFSDGNDVKNQQTVTTSGPQALV